MLHGRDPENIRKILSKISIWKLNPNSINLPFKVPLNDFQEQ